VTGKQEAGADRPECMTCSGASTEEIAVQAIIHGEVPLCREHAEVLVEVAREKGLTVSTPWLSIDERVRSAREHIHRVFEEVEAPHLNPDCEAGKHAACRGDAWCFVEDTGVSCGCSCHDREVDRG